MNESDPVLDSPMRYEPRDRTEPVKKSGKVIIDHESKITSTGEPIRGVMVVNYSSTDFRNSIKKVEKTSFGPKVVQYIDSETGETVKGPLYDKTELEPPTENIKDKLKSGIKQQVPESEKDDMPYEPRNRFQENKNMSMTKDKFSKLVQECMSELKSQKSPRQKLKESLRPMIQQVLSEISNVKTKGIDDDKDEVEKVRKGFIKKPVYEKDPSARLDIDNDEKLAELEKIVKGINGEWETYWDDYGQMIVRAQNLLYVRIVPKFENNFDIDAYVKLVDRIRAIALNWEQVKDFVKENFKDVGKNPEGNKTKADKAWEKSMANKVDQDKNKKSAGPKNDLLKNRLEDPENTKLKTAKKKDRDYKEDQVTKDEDQPDQQMKDVGEPKNLNKNIEKTPKVKPPKHENDKTLIVKDKKTSKFRSRK